MYKSIRPFAEERTLKCQARKKENHSWEHLSLLSVISGVSGSRHGVSERFALFIWCSRAKEKVSWGGDNLHWMAMIPKEVKKSHLLPVSMYPKTFLQPRSCLSEVHLSHKWWQREPKASLSAQACRWSAVGIILQLLQIFIRSISALMPGSYYCALPLLC